MRFGIKTVLKTFFFILKNIYSKKGIINRFKTYNYFENIKLTYPFRVNFIKTFWLLRICKRSKDLSVGWVSREDDQNSMNLVHLRWVHLKKKECLFLVWYTTNRQQNTQKKESEMNFWVCKRNYHNNPTRFNKAYSILKNQIGRSFTTNHILSWSVTSTCLIIINHKI